MPVSSSPSRGYNCGLRRCRPTMPHMVFLRFLERRQVLLELPRTNRAVVGEELVAFEPGVVRGHTVTDAVEYSGNHCIRVQFVNGVEQGGRERGPAIACGADGSGVE